MDKLAKLITKQVLKVILLVLKQLVFLHFKIHTY